MLWHKIVLYVFSLPTMADKWTRRFHCELFLICYIDTICVVLTCFCFNYRVKWKILECLWRWHYYCRFRYPTRLFHWTEGTFQTMHQNCSRKLCYGREKRHFQSKRRWFWHCNLLGILKNKKRCTLTQIFIWNMNAYFVIYAFSPHLSSNCKTYWSKSICLFYHLKRFLNKHICIRIDEIFTMNNLLEENDIANSVCIILHLYMHYAQQVLFVIFAVYIQGYIPKICWKYTKEKNNPF